MPDDLGRERRLYVRLTRDRCTRDYGVGPCTAALGVTGAAKCWKTFPTCQDVANYDRGSVTLLFGQNVAGHPKTGTIFPALIDVSERPVEVNLSGVDPKSTALGKRARVTATFRDFTYHGALIDPYADERRSGVAQDDGLPRDPGLGTFWTDLDARDPYFEGRRIEVLRCLPGDDPFTVSGAVYDVAEMSGPGSSGVVTVIGQDPLNLLDGARSLYPPPSRGGLVADLTVGGLAFTLTPAGIGDLDYPASGLVKVGREIMGFTRVADAVTVTARGAEGTVAAEHKAGDAVQRVSVVTGRISDALAEVLTGLGGPIDPALVDSVAWTAAHDEWMGGTVLRAVLCDPTSRALLAGELLQLGVGLAYDETVPSLDFFVNAPKLPGQVYDLLSEEASLIRETVEVTRAHEGRISGVYVHSGMPDPTAEATRASSFAGHTFITDPSSAGASEWGSERVKEVFLRWFGREGNQAVIGLIFERLVSRYRDAPKVLTGMVDARDMAKVAPGKRVLVKSRALGAVDGVPVPVLMQINRREPRGGRVAIRAERFAMEGRFGFLLATPGVMAACVTAVAYLDIDPRLPGLQYQTETTGTPVTATGQSLGRVEGLARVMPVALTQSASGSRPVVQAGYFDLDGTDDRLEGEGAALALLRAASSVTLALRFRMTSVAAGGMLVAFSTTNSAAVRLSVDVRPSGQIRVILRRLDVDATTTELTASSPVTSGVDVSLLVVVDWAAGTIAVHVNDGADLMGGAIAGTPGPTSPTDSARVRVGSSLAASPTLHFGGRVHRVSVLVGVVPDAAARTAIFADLAGVLQDYDLASQQDRDEGAYLLNAGDVAFGDGTPPYIMF